MMFLENSYKLTAAPGVTSRNLVGTALASVSGTPGKEGIWRVRIATGAAGDAPLMAFVMEVRDSNDSKKIPVVASGAYTHMIPGTGLQTDGTYTSAFTVTLGATVVVGDEFEVSYTSVIADAV